jgi:hypothetical protein
MNYLDFTAEEANLIAIYAASTRAATIAAIVDALPHMDTEMRGIASRSAAKLAVMSDEDFAEEMFTLVNEDDDIV